jgi:hypothetical protein
LPAEPAAKLLERRSLDRLGEPHRRDHEREHAVAVGRGNEVDEVDAIRESVDLVRGGPDR